MNIIYQIGHIESSSIRDGWRRSDVPAVMSCQMFGYRCGDDWRSPLFYVPSFAAQAHVYIGDAFNNRTLGHLVRAFGPFPTPPRLEVLL